MKIKVLMGLLFFCSLPIMAKIVFPSVISDNMVLQQNATVNLWGKANPNVEITIIPSWEKIEYKSKVDEFGRWLLKIDTPSAGGPYEIIFNDGEKKVLRNILIGEVWFCSGQSNMAMPMKGFVGQPVEGANDYIAQAKKSVPIRMFTSANRYGRTPLEDCIGVWSEHTPEGVADCSAVAYFYAKYLQKVLEVPIGLVISSWSGSKIEAWMSKEALQVFPEFELSFLDSDMKTELPVNQTPCYLYYGKICPLTNYTIKGAIWYQGESNLDNRPLYKRLFPAFVRDLRKSFQQGDFPFYYTQIAPFAYYDNPDLTSGAEMREVQLKCMDSIPNSGMAVTLDIGDSGCIHPARKKEVGYRLAYWALAKTYNKSAIAYEGPVYQSLTVKNGKALLTFKNSVAKGVGPINKKLEGFEIAGKKRKFYPANAFADVRSGKVVVYCDSVPEPMAVRYAFKNYTEASLFNELGLPASSFRTDNW